MGACLALFIDNDLNLGTAPPHPR